MLSISFNRLSTKALHDLGRRVLALLLTLIDGILKDNPLVTDLQQKFNEYDEVIVKKRSMKLGDFVREKDNYRDKVYRAFRRALNGIAAFEGTAKGDAAAKLLTVVDAAGNIDGLNYEEQNTVMDKAIASLQTAENAALLTTVGLGDEFAVMKNSQADFKELADEQSSGNAELQNTPYASKLRTELEGSLRNVFALVSALRQQPEWKNLYQLLAQYIKDAESPGAKPAAETQPETPAE